MSLIAAVQLLAAYHAGVLTAYLLLRRISPSLALLCLAFAAHMLANLVTEQAQLPPQANITSAFGLLYGPGLWLFVRGLCYRQARPSWRDLVHLMPALTVIIIRPSDPWPQLAGLPLLIGYLVATFLALREHGLLTRQVRADDDRVSLRWVGHAFYAFVAIAIFDIARSTFPAGLSVFDDAGLALVLVAVTALLTVLAWRTRSHVRDRGALSPRGLDAGRAGAASKPDDADALADFARIDDIVRRQELWREPRLSLADIARIAGGNTRDVSRAVNAGSGGSFSAYVNGLRIDAVDAMMADPARAGDTLLALAFEAGFNSKSAFNRFYREQRGETPSRSFARAGQAREADA
ncbi:helix-turn-helix domain-containing protein [Maricaulis maris]|uniref:AraC-like DNA-binding protein n=1 Tax=Maricaulis maris TaxID=74318 RepID=A0A495DMX4_9PROT|nr:helix-turn-helix domain-containing protein [Maricaulis maris]RKR03611.1 AraC-like DNA-binding protein [Maricaulis maris]